uniref:store-operated calcium entry-associated regulatory factor-like n=1 Tax=Styela clava TaxID=7725 RepID=UPI00193A9CC2|nr:store-operated calcium entry-associated regulatory factor-like [Styela clava]
MWLKITILLGIVILCCTPCMWTFGFGSDRVLLRDISAITLHQGQMTTGRRSSPVPQLKCVGGTAGCHGFVPQTVQCRNVGFDGHDVQWECKTDMDDSYRFGKVQVTCEGYDYPDDPYVLKGSCGLEYTIDVTDAGKSRNQNSWGGDNYGQSNLQHKESSGSCFLGLLVVGAIVFLIYKMCSAVSDNQPNHSRGTSSNHRSPPGNQPPPYGFKPEYSQTGGNYEPPPAYSDATGDRTRTSSSTTTNNSSPAGGFWSGMGWGGVLGYLFGRRGNNYGYGYPRNNYGTGYNGGWGGSGWGGNRGWGSSGWGGNRGWGSSWQTGTSHTTYRGSRSSSSGTSRTASGFGGTSRR